MELEAGMGRKIVLSVVAVVLLVASFVAVGSSYGGQGLEATGGLAIVGVITAFILLMAVIGVYLDRQDD